MKWLTNSVHRVGAVHQAISAMPAEARKGWVHVAVALVIAALGGPLMPPLPAPDTAKRGFDPSRLRHLAVLLVVIAALSVLFLVGGGV